MRGNEDASDASLVFSELIEHAEKSQLAEATPDEGGP
jgi:hypothetical protein